jgi:DNA relaxase NicK
MEAKFRDKMTKYSYVGGSEGTTVYFGRKVSDIMIRIYDKAAEQEKEGHWIRTEIQLRDEMALAFAKKIIANELSQAFLGTIKNYLRFVKPNKNDLQNKDRWPMTTYWQKFLKGAERITLYTKPGVEYNMGKLHDYVINQAGGAIRTYIKIMGVAELQRLIESKGKNQKYEDLITRLKNSDKIPKEIKEKERNEKTMENIRRLNEKHPR